MLPMLLYHILPSEFQYSSSTVPRLFLAPLPSPPLQLLQFMIFLETPQYYFHSPLFMSLLFYLYSTHKHDHPVFVFSLLLHLAYSLISFQFSASCKELQDFILYHSRVVFHPVYIHHNFFTRLLLVT